MNLMELAESVAEELERTDTHLVLAESCSGGLVAATLTSVPGISAHFAGSLVVYQEASKSKWLGVDVETLAEHGAVSAPVAHQMAGGALNVTPHADLAVSITGHLGPDAPDGLDGLLFLGLAAKSGPVRTWGHRLESKGRGKRQNEAACRVLQTVLERLSRA